MSVSFSWVFVDGYQYIYTDRCVHKISGITVTEKRSECLGAAAVWHPVRRWAGQARPRATAVCCRALYLDDSVILKNGRGDGSSTYLGQQMSITRIYIVMKLENWSLHGHCSIEKADECLLCSTADEGHSVTWNLHFSHFITTGTIFTRI